MVITLQICLLHLRTLALYPLWMSEQQSKQSGTDLPQLLNITDITYCKSLIFSVHYIQRFYALSVLASF